MASLNFVQIIGHLGRDPELRSTGGGNQVCNFTVATDESYQDQQGNRQEKTQWHNVVVWGKLADICGKYLHKGSLVYLSGKLQTRKWQDKDGNDRYQTEIVAQQVIFLDKREGGSQGTQQRTGGNQQPSQQQPRQTQEPKFPTESQGLDEVPF